MDELNQCSRAGTELRNHNIEIWGDRGAVYNSWMQGLNNLSIYCLACLLPHHRFALCLKYVCAQNLQLIFGEGVIISVKSHSTGRELGKGKARGKAQHFVRAEDLELEKHSIFKYAWERQLEKTQHFQSRPGKGKTQHLQSRRGKGIQKTKHVGKNLCNMVC